MSTAPPLDDTLYVALGPHLFSYDNFACLRPVSPPAGCPAPGGAPEAAPGLPLLAATAANIFQLASPPPTCGAPLLPPAPRRSITSLRASASRGVFFTDGEGGAVWWAPAPGGSAGGEPRAPPRPLLQDGGPDLITGARAGLALWGGHLYYGAAGRSAWPGESAEGALRFRGVLRAGLDGGGPGVFFRYGAGGDTAFWSVARLAAAGEELAWTELRAPPSRPPAVWAVQRTRLGGGAANGSVTPATSFLGEAAGPEAAQAAGDGALGGVVWASAGAAVAAFSAGPVRGMPFFSLDFAQSGVAGAVTGLAFAQGSAACGYRFSYDAPGGGGGSMGNDLFCAPRSRVVVPGAQCAMEAVVAAVASSGWATPLLAVAGLMAVALCAWVARCFAARCGCTGVSLRARCVNACCGNCFSGMAPRSTRSAGAFTLVPEEAASASGGPGSGEAAPRVAEEWAVEVELGGVGEEKAAVKPRPQPLRLLASRGARGGRGRKLSSGSIL